MYPSHFKMYYLYQDTYTVLSIVSLHELHNKSTFLAYIYIYIYIYIRIKEDASTNFTGVQASGVIIVYCDSAVSYGPKIIGPHSSGKFNFNCVLFNPYIYLALLPQH